jgi:hypothetical protein
MNRVLCSSKSPHWNTPSAFYEMLNREFHFNDDPCPAGGMFGLDREWGTSTYCNPPYGRFLGDWIEKGLNESRKGKRVVFLVPSRTDTKWFQDYVLPYASEIRFIRGRLRFPPSENPAPFPSVVIVFNGSAEGGQDSGDGRDEGP